MGAPRHGPPEMSFLRKRHGKVNAQKAPCLDAKMSKKSLRCKKCCKNQLASMKENNMSNSRKDKNERPRKRVRRSLWRRAGPQEENPMQKVRRSFKRGAGPRTTLLTGSGSKRYKTIRKARRKDRMSLGSACNPRSRLDRARSQ